MINCIVLDDEPLAISIIEGHISKVESLNLIGSFTSPVDAFSAIHNKDVDVVFLDINMPVISGLEFIKTLKKKPLIVLTTAYRDYAVESYELDVLDYLIKPIPYSRFLKSVDKILSILKDKVNDNTEKEYILLEDGNNSVKISVDDILFVESLKDYIKVSTLGGNHLLHQSLSEIEKLLLNESLIKVHESFIVNIEKVNSLNGDTIEINGKEIPIADEHQELLRSKLNN